MCLVVCLVCLPLLVWLRGKTGYKVLMRSRSRERDRGDLRPAFEREEQCERDGGVEC